MMRRIPGGEQPARPCESLEEYVAWVAKHGGAA